MEAQGEQFKRCITIEQKKSDVKGLQDKVLATIMSSPKWRHSQVVVWWWGVDLGEGVQESDHPWDGWEIPGKDLRGPEVELAALCLRV